MKTLKFVFGLVFAAAVFVGCNAPSVGSDKTKELVSFRSSDLADEQNLKLLDVNWTAEPAGAAQKFERSFENAPPMIPHDLEGLLPITADMNMCVTCHMPEFAKDSGATPIPASHLYSIRNQKDLHGKLSDDRYTCNQCHAPQANITAKFKNNFKPEFRQKDGQSRSNLLDILNDGVR